MTLALSSLRELRIIQVTNPANRPKANPVATSICSSSCRTNAVTPKAAIAAIRGRAFLDDFFEENLKDQEVKDLMTRVECTRDPELDQFYPRQWPAWVRIEGVDGRTYTAEIMFPKGDPENPLSWDELIEKFMNLTHPVLPADRQHAIIAHVRQADPEQPDPQRRSINRAGSIHRWPPVAGGKSRCLMTESLT